MATTKLTGTLIRSGSIPTTALGGGVFSSSIQISSALPGGTVSSSAQVKPLLPGGTVSASAQVDITATTNYSTFSSSLATVDAGQTTRIDNLASLTSSYAINATIQGQLAGVVSSSTQVKPLLPGGTVSASGQVDITATTNYSTFSSSLATIDAGQTARIDNLASLTSSYAINSTIQSQLTGVISSSAQTVALIANQTIAPTAVNATNINSTAVTASGLTANQAVFTNASDGLVSNAITGTGNVVMSASPTLTGTLTAANITANGTLLLQNIVSQSSAPSFTGLTSTGTVLLAGIYSSSAQTVAAIASQTIAPTTVNATSILSSSVLQTGTNALIGGKLAVTGALEVTGTVTASNLTANQAVFTNAVDGLVSNAITGTGNVVMSASPTLTGTLTAANITATGTMLLAGIVSQSSQIDYNSITNKLSGVVSSSTQVQPLLPGGTVSSSAQTVAAIASQTIAPTNVNATNILSGSVLQTGTNALIGGKLAVTGALEVTGTVTASNLTANQAVFTNAVDGLVSNAITGTGNVVMSASPTLTGTLTAANITANGTLLLQSIFSSSTQVDYNSIQNKLSGVVSSSTQVKPLLPDGTVSSSAQYPGWVTASSQIALSGITGTTFAATNFTFPNNLTVGGTLTAQEINTEYVSASVIFESGSSKFGDTADDVMSVTGSIRVLAGTISGSMVGMFSSSAQTDITATTGYSTFSSSIATKNNLQDVSITALNAATSSYAINSTIQSQLAGVASSSAQVKTYLPADTVSSSTQVVAGVSAQTIAPTNVNATNILSGSVLQTGTNALIGGKLAVTGALEVTGTVTASNLTANQAVFTNASDGFVSNAITGTGNVVMSASPTLTGTVTAANITANGTLLLQNIVSQSSAPSFTGLTSTGTVLLAGIYSSSAQTVAAIANQTIAPTTVNATSILSSSVLQTGTNALIGGKLAVTGALEVTGTVTASNLTANQAVFTNAVDGLVSNAITGTGNVVMSTSPTLVTPILGTPTSVTLTNATGLPVSTGISGLGTGVATFLATPSSANLAAALTDETGTGANVFAGSPTLTGTVTANNIVMSGSQFSGIVSGSGLQYRLVVPVGTNQYAT